jgi:hypothetical protein
VIGQYLPNKPPPRENLERSGMDIFRQGWPAAAGRWDGSDGQLVPVLIFPSSWTVRQCGGGKISDSADFFCRQGGQAAASSWRASAGAWRARWDTAAGTARIFLRPGRFLPAARQDSSAIVDPWRRLSYSACFICTGKGGTTVKISSLLVMRCPTGLRREKGRRRQKETQGNYAPVGGRCP